jgi:uncharacterized protein
MRSSWIAACSDGRTVPEPYVPVPTPETEPYWAAADEDRLSIQRCRSCGRHYFYPQSHCRYCASDAVEWVDVSGHATLESFVLNGRPLPGTEHFAKVIAIVRLEEGVLMMSNIIDVEPVPENLPLDLPLTVAFLERGGRSIPVFRPREV